MLTIGEHNGQRCRLATLEARASKQEELAAFLRAARPLAVQKAAIVSCVSFRIDSARFGSLHTSAQISLAPPLIRMISLANPYLQEPRSYWHPRLPDPNAIWHHQWCNGTTSQAALKGLDDDEEVIKHWGTGLR